MKTYHYGGCSIPIQIKIYLSIYLSGHAYLLLIFGHAIAELLKMAELSR